MTGGLSPTARRYLDAAAEILALETPEQTAARITDLTWGHEAWRARGALNMNAAEGVMSRGARRLLATDFATRVTEGAPGDKVFPHGLQNRFIDPIEAALIAVTAKLFGVRYVEWRPVTTSMANAAVFSARKKRVETTATTPPAFPR
jgi:glycine/serine hydroxymethyltransferase